MKSGTLSNVTQGKFLVVWEGLIATLPDPGAESRFRTFDRAKARGKALRQYETNVISYRALNDLAYRRSFPVDLVTLLDPSYEQKLRARARGDELPVNSVKAHTEESLDEYARLTPYVLGVIHPFVNRPLLFGSKGITAAPGQAWQI